MSLADPGHELRVEWWTYPMGPRTPSDYRRGMGFIAWILMGLIAGAIAKSILNENGGWLTSLAIGLVGAVVGGWIGSAVFDRGVTGFFSLWSWLLAIGGSVLVLWVYGKLAGRRR